MFDTIKHVVAASRIYREAFGHLRGFLLWIRTRRDYKLPIGEFYSLTVPRLSAPVWLRAGTSDLPVFQQVFCDKETDFDLSLSEPHFIIDAGANIGLSSIIFAARWPSAQVVALEVDADNFKALLRNVKTYPRIRPIRKALWGSDGFVKIVNPTAEPWAFQVVEAKMGEAGAIEAISLNEILSQFNCRSLSLLKLDIEGTELDIFRSNDLSWVDRTGAIAVELHDRFRPGCSEAFDHMLAGRRFSQWRQGEYHVVKFF